MPATTMMTPAPSSASRRESSRWIPATPTSVRRSARQPIASAVTAASSATGRSLVPAVTTSTDDVAGVGGTAGRRHGVGRHACHEHAVAPFRNSASDRDDLVGGLAAAVDDFGEALPQRAMMVDRGEAERFRGLQRQGVEGALHREGAVRDLGEQVANPLTPHAASASTPSSPDSVAMSVAAAYRSAFAR